MIRKILKLISNIIFSILLVMLAISFYSWVQINVLHKPYSEFMGYSVFEVVTGSMSGTIEINDYIVVKNDKNLHLKDIITFRDNNALVTHRVVELKENSIITRGDANNSDDVEITYNDVIGKVVYVFKNGGVWKKVFTDTKVIGLLFVTMLFFSIYFSIDKKTTIEDTKERDEIEEVVESQIKTPRKTKSKKSDTPKKITPKKDKE